MLHGLALVLLLLCVVSAEAQTRVRTLRVGGTETSWRRGGGGTDPLVLGGTLFSPKLDTTNTPDDAVDFANRPGWISPLSFDEQINVAARVLEEAGSIRSPNSVEEKKVVRAQLAEAVNGNHDIAFERKPTQVVPLNPQGIWVILDFGIPIGVHRVRFYPRNTVVETPRTPFHNDFLRAYELFINPTQTSAQRSPDILVARDTANESPIVDIDVPQQYTRLVKLKSLTQVPWEIDEFEVYASGFLERATYLSDLIDLGDRATLGPVRWREVAIGRDIRSTASVRLRTGTDDTPLIFEERILDSVGVWLGETQIVDQTTWVGLNRRQRGVIVDDEENWSPWKAAESGALITAPGQRRYLQFQVDIEGELFDSRQINWVEFDYLQPPLGDTLRAEVFPRRVPAEKRATFRYAVLLRAAGPIRGYDRLEIDANALVEDLREMTIDGEPAAFDIEYVRRDGFAITFEPIRRDSTVLEFTFDIPVFRFGTTFSARAYHTPSGDVPQRLEAGEAADFGPGDFAELSDLSVVIPREQVGQLIGEILVDNQIFTPNGDLVNDDFEVFFNLLQLTKPTPVTMEIYDLSGRR
ncbi:MAG: hypothetical protein CME04_20810, partial [Gemmatimonadaceae bacterium]|nr:hypothetical protein [Gemmatimonadaceae bacterium]